MTTASPLAPPADVRRRPSRARGFTLLEIMIALAIVGILAAIALPSYQSYVYRAEAAEVILVLDKIRTALAGVQADRGSLGDKIIIGSTGVTSSGGIREPHSCVRGVRGASSDCQPISGLTRADLDLARLGIRLDVQSGYANTDQPGQYVVSLQWTRDARGAPPTELARTSRQIALATRQVMQPHTYRDIVRSSEVRLYFKL